MKMSRPIQLSLLSRASFRATTPSISVTDSDGAQNSTQAMLCVNKAMDYRPVANAGPNQVITLPRKTIILYGNQSTDDHDPLAYGWSLSPDSKGKVVEMQDVLNNSDHQAVLFLGNLVEGKYRFTLTVTDNKGQSSSDRGTVEVRSDMWELVELVLEEPVSQVSHRQRDMLLRQVGVLLGILDITVREISAFNKHSLPAELFQQWGV